MSRLTKFPTAPLDIFFGIRKRGAGVLIRGPDAYKPRRGWMVMWIKEGRPVRVRHSRWWLFAICALVWFRIWRWL